MHRQRVTAVVHAGPNSSRAGLQIKIDGRAQQGFLLSLPNKKKPIRFCVGNRQRRSSVWNAWANRTASDVYIAIRSSANLHKFSLHESGDFRHQLIGMTKETLTRTDLALASTSDDEHGRILHRWRRPEANSVGWIDCMSILIPAEELQSGPLTAREAQEAVWVPSPAEGYAIDVRAFLVHPGQGEFELTGAMNEAGPLSVRGASGCPTI